MNICSQLSNGRTSGELTLTPQHVFEVAQQDLSEKYEWLEAKTACSKLSDRWRLPTKEELIEMYRLHQKTIGEFKLTQYWSSEGLGNKYALSIDFSNGLESNNNYSSKYPPEKHYVRPVRNI